MIKSSTISARIDPVLKEDAEKIFNDLGLTASQAIALFYRQVTLQQGLPFDVRLPQTADQNGMIDAPAAEPTPSGFYASPERAQLLQEQAAFEAMHAELWARYPHQFVAVVNDEVVDRDEDEVALLKRRRQHYPNQVVLLKPITENPVRTLYIRSPRIVRE